MYEEAPDFSVYEVAPGFSVHEEAPGFSVYEVAPGFSVYAEAPGFRPGPHSSYCPLPLPPPWIVKREVIGVNMVKNNDQPDVARTFT